MLESASHGLSLFYPDFSFHDVLCYLWGGGGEIKMKTTEGTGIEHFRDKTSQIPKSFGLGGEGGR